MVCVCVCKIVKRWLKNLTYVCVLFLSQPNKKQLHITKSALLRCSRSVDLASMGVSPNTLYWTDIASRTNEVHAVHKQRHVWEAKTYH